MRGSVLLLSANKQRQYQQRKMFLKLTLIGMAFVPFIAGIQLETPTRVGKFLGWLSVNKAAPLKRFLSTKTRWQGELSLTFERWPLTASVGLHHYIDNLDRPNPHVTVAFDSNNVLEEFDSTSSKPSDDSVSSNADVQSVSTEAVPLNSTAETTQEAPSALKLEDYVEIVFDPEVEENRVRRETDKDESNQISNDVSDDEIDSTTVELSTLAAIEEQESTEGKYATLPPPTHQTFYLTPTPSSPQFPYPASRNPTAQYVTFTQSPHYNFYPSHPDYQSFVPCFYVNSQPHPNEGTWPNYHKWK